MIKKFTAAILAAVAVATAAAPAGAVITTFASFSPITQASNVLWTNSGPGQLGTSATFVSTTTANTSVLGPRLVSFSFLLPLLSTYTTGVTALFTLNAGVTNTPAQSAFGQVFQDNINGSFSFKTIAPLTVGFNTFAAGSNLLTGTFASTLVSGQRGGHLGVVQRQHDGRRYADLHLGLPQLRQRQRQRLCHRLVGGDRPAQRRADQHQPDRRAARIPRRRQRHVLDRSRAGRHFGSRACGMGPDARRLLDGRPADAPPQPVGRGLTRSRPAGRTQHKKARLPARFFYARALR